MSLLSVIFNLKLHSGKAGQKRHFHISSRNKQKCEYRENYKCALHRKTDKKMVRLVKKCIFRCKTRFLVWMVTSGTVLTIPDSDQKFSKFFGHPPNKNIQKFSKFFGQKKKNLSRGSGQFQFFWLVKIIFDFRPPLSYAVNWQGKKN